MKIFKVLPVFFLIILTAYSASGEDKKQRLEHYDFEDLLIKVKIQEPEVLFILDTPHIQAEPMEEDMNFLDKIEDPVSKDNIF